MVTARKADVRKNAAAQRYQERSCNQGAIKRKELALVGEKGVTPPRAVLTHFAEGSERLGQVDLLPPGSVRGFVDTDRLPYGTSSGVAASRVGCSTIRITGIQDGRHG
ncbi:hypothetical protein HPB47_008243 [Ixodes persulcatus]|uniref:Uncharacterized protein n=1 Tax=Ixodes persulcatus TaxID=34615 RepID=A0AC60P5Q1_IXOPE|nr:hypothetical protein HPB47_008243 [Ixodes persulcatus]